MQLAVPRQSLDGRDLGAVSLDRENRAGLRAAAINEDRAGAALARVAADVGTRQVELVAQHVREQGARLYFDRPGRAVHVEGDGPFHDGGLS